MLAIKNLTASYGGPVIIENVHLEVRENEIVTIIGPNGAGKSTVLRSIFGLTDIKPESSILFFNHELTNLMTKDISTKGICYVPQGKIVFRNLTVEENLSMGAFIEEEETELTKNRHYVYQKFPRLHERRHQKAKNLSGGEQQMLAIGRALMLRPQLLLLDEPSIGLAPKVVAEVFEKLEEIHRDGTAMLMVEQNANMALEISDRAYVLELGKNRYEGAAKELREDPRIGELYLGKK